MLVDLSVAQTDSAECHFSALAQEPDLADLVERFVLSLPETLATMRQAAATENWPEIGRLAHQIKGAGGSYGFPHLTVAAADLERAARQSGKAADVLSALERLSTACAKSKAGIGP